jgi:glycosyltransferase involved in cell wall biosynthesis
MKEINLLLFFTRGVSLKSWHDTGVLMRDTMLYRMLEEEGIKTTFVTYGKDNDRDYVPEGSSIKVLSKPEGMSVFEFSRKASSIYKNEFGAADIIKSHQMPGAAAAAWYAIKSRKPYVARCGYLPSYFVRREGSRFDALLSAIEEAFASHVADTVCVPSIAEIDALHAWYNVKKSKCVAAPNWIDTDFFKPDRNMEKNPKLVSFVGRLESQKQPLLLLEALKGIEGVKLLMVGRGRMEEDVRRKMSEMPYDVELITGVDNEKLPLILNSSAVHFLPTLYEGGSPKTLLEAMACGLPVVSTNGFGVNEAFEDNVHGFKHYCDDVEGFRSSIKTLLENTDLATKMGNAGRQHIIDNFSINKALEREVNIIRNLADRK